MFGVREREGVSLALLRLYRAGILTIQGFYERRSRVCFFIGVLRSRYLIASKWLHSEASWEETRSIIQVAPYSYLWYNKTK